MFSGLRTNKEAVARRGSTDSITGSNAHAVQSTPIISLEIVMKVEIPPVRQPSSRFRPINNYAQLYIAPVWWRIRGHSAQSHKHILVPGPNDLS